MQKGRRFLYNAVLLALVNIALRMITVSFNTFVSAKVGAEGMGLLTLVMSVYGLSVTVAASGVNLAAVRLTARALAESEEEKYVHGSVRLRRVMRGCVIYSLCFGIGAAVVLFASSDAIGTHLLGDGRTVPSLRVLALSLPAISLSSALAGYFTGVRRVYKNAIVSVAEQFVKITLTACTLILFAPAGIEYACLAVVGGGAVAEGGSLLLAWILYRWDSLRCKKGKSPALPPAFPQVFCTAFPVAVGAYVTRMRTLNGSQWSKGKEMHLCPMQFDIADRVIEQMSSPGDIVLDPFGGLMTVPYRALLKGRKAQAVELNPQYFLDGAQYCKAAEMNVEMPSLFDLDLCELEEEV